MRTSIDNETQDLIRHLFALATARLEAAHTLSTRGQAAHLNPETYAVAAQELREILREIDMIASPIPVIVNSAED